MHAADLNRSRWSPCRLNEQARLRALAFLSVARLVLSWGLALRMTEPNTPSPFDHLRTLFSPGSTHTRDGPRVAPSVVQPQEDMSANQVSAQLRAAGELDTVTDVSNSPNQPAPHTTLVDVGAFATDIATQRQTHTFAGTT